jgi:hypothetical protein
MYKVVISSWNTQNMRKISTPETLCTALWSAPETHTEKKISNFFPKFESLRVWENKLALPALPKQKVCSLKLIDIVRKSCRNRNIFECLEWFGAGMMA